MDKKTPLYNEHLKANAKMTSFAGWEMPVSYTSISDEHNCVRENVGMFDVSHMGEFFVSGENSLNFLQTIVPQNLEKLTDGKAVYCQLTNENGGIIDDLIIYKLEDNNYFIIVNASRIDVDFAWMQGNAKNFSNVILENKSDIYSLLAIQGPKATDLISKIGISKEKQPQFFSIKKSKINNIDIMLSRTGYTGEDGFEILVKNGHVSTLWDLLLQEGKEFHIQPIGLGARDTLRLEAALPLYGNDLDIETTPVEAGLTWSVSKNKVNDYNGKNIIFNQLKNGTQKKLICFKMLSKIPARHNYEVFYQNKKIGHVTSGVPSPTLKENIGMAYVLTSCNISIDTIIQIMIRNKLYDAKVVSQPFVKKKNKV